MVALEKKLKTALGETRLLVLGAQILVGFQFRTVFEEGFSQLPESSRHLDGLALLLMVGATALLITPSMHHQIASGGADTGRTHRILTILAAGALLPFAGSLALDVFIALERLGGRLLGLLAGLGFGLLALFWWFGFELIRRRRVGQTERAMSRKQRSQVDETPLHTKIEEALTEARIIIPGAQALLGFQLAIVMMPSFGDLPRASKIMHAASLGMIALSVILLMAPAAYHRIVYAGEETAELHRTVGRLVTAATLPLALGLAGDVYVVIAKIFGSQAVATAAGLFAVLACVGLWYAYPALASRTVVRADADD